jgi:hypothetical protein
MYDSLPLIGTRVVLPANDMALGFVLFMDGTVKSVSSQRASEQRNDRRREERRLKNKTISFSVSID